MADAFQVHKSTDVAITNPHNIRSVYANNVGASATATDVRIFFTELGTSPLGGPEQTLMAQIVIPIPIARNLIEVLGTVMQQVESIKNASGEKETPSAKQ